MIHQGNEVVPEVYVLWHPGFSEGEALARTIYGWVRPNGLGPQVFYRSLPAPEAPKPPESLPHVLPPCIPRERRKESGEFPRYPESSDNNLQVVILLIDANLIADATWRHWINELAESAVASRRVLLPVALDGTAYNVPPAMHACNFLRPAGVAATGPDGRWSLEQREVVIRSLLKQLTEALCDLMLQFDEFRGGGAPLEVSRSKVKIFLSHAKADGTEPAKRIRDYIYSQTQIAAFFDENDIPFGSLFDKVLDGNVAGSARAAALIAVRSAVYADRPWCRRELSLFRQPRQERVRGRRNQFWMLNPVLVVDALSDGDETVCIPEFGNVPTIRWSSAIPLQEEKIVTSVLRNVLLGAHNQALGRSMPDESDCIVLNWRPDIATLMQIPRVRNNTKCRVFYPGRDLSGPELRYLGDFFSRVRFISFDRIAP
ncbi:toll/interleukin-1 receptor domain-containing protein [Zoogloea sp.]|uniref:toll/interleukin-1 receptor domain-containing protein n=1 Tax=Zoogloea sp. TaxID=49181 RepID=UPI0026327424|nr:toll/interleukin-1 receptor domain-containing protein [Zoogloea sp.]